MTKIDFLIVGAGLYGSTFAREMTDAGYSCKIIDKRHHIGGNCYTEKKCGIDVHKYGPHIFHTNNQGVWEFVNRFAEFNRYTHTCKANYKHNLYSMPINLNTINPVWGVTSPQMAREMIKDQQSIIKDPKNLEEWALANVGEKLYKLLIKGYTEKQWGKKATELPASIIKRLPIRFTYNDNYFDDLYQGIPVNGYTDMFKNMTYDIEIELNVDYLKDRDKWDSMAKKVVYTGAIDEFFEYKYGDLEWRSLRFEEQTYNIDDYQGTSIINYTHRDIPFTRIVEHKHFNKTGGGITVISKEYPLKYSRGLERFYPINDERNNALYEKYKKLIDSKYIFGGRLGRYKYYDMHQVIGSALRRAFLEHRKM